MTNEKALEKICKQKLLGLSRLIRQTIKLYADNEMSVYAGYTTLYIMMAMVPLLALLVGVVNMLPDVSLQHLEAAVNDLLPNVPEVRILLHTLITNVNRQAGSLAISLSLVASLWSASNGVNAIQMGFCKISGTGGLPAAAATGIHAVYGALYRADSGAAHLPGHARLH